MAINEILTGTGISAETTPAGITSEVVVEGGPNGSVILQEKVTGGTWTNIAAISGAYVVATPDDTISYRFSCKNLEETVRVYFGA